MFGRAELSEWVSIFDDDILEPFSLGWSNADLNFHLSQTWIRVMNNNRIFGKTDRRGDLKAAHNDTASDQGTQGIHDKC